MDKIPDVILVAAAVGVFVGGTVWALAWWLSGQFSEIRAFVYAQTTRIEHSILEKLEYHEKHDDTRFANIRNELDNIRNDLWEVKVRNAAIRGIIAKAKGPVTAVVGKLQEHFLEEDT